MTVNEEEAKNRHIRGRREKLIEEWEKRGMWK